MPQAMKKLWQLTVAGEVDPDQDVLELFTGTDEEVQAHILQRETEYQIGKLFTRGYGRGKGTITLTEFAEAEFERGADPDCDQWCRWVREVKPTPFLLSGLITKAQTDAPTLMEQRLQEARQRIAQYDPTHNLDKPAGQSVQADSGWLRIIRNIFRT